MTDRRGIPPGLLRAVLVGLALVVLAVVLSGCVSSPARGGAEPTRMVRDDGGGSQAELDRDGAQCDAQAQQAVPAGSVPYYSQNPAVAAYGSTIATNNAREQFWINCMRGRGWRGD